MTTHTSFENSSNSKIKIVSSILALGVLVLMVFWLAGAFHDKVTPGAEQALGSITHVSEQHIASRSEYDMTEPVSASLSAKQDVILSSRILARINKVHRRAGQSVKQGDILIELEKSDLQSRLRQAQANLASTVARYEETEKALVRSKELHEKGLLAVARLESAQANYNTSLAQQNGARQALVEAQTALEFAVIRSPIDGVVIDRFAEPGDMAQPTKALMSIYNPESIRVEAYVRENLAVTLNVGDRIKVEIPAMSFMTESVIEEIVPSVNTASRAFLIKARFDTAKGLLPGMYAKLHIHKGTKSMIKVPNRFVLSVGQMDVVLVQQGGTVERRYVRTGETDDKAMIEVISGLTVGESLVIPN